MTIQDVFPGDEPAEPPETCCEHICDNQSAGLLVCEGSGSPGIMPDPGADGVKYVMTCLNGLKQWENAANLAALPNAAPEQAPEPRESNGGPGEQVHM